ncbi:MAG: hypothetical protein ACYDER_14570 [Ktedonobacteraceae bacterium]
MLHNVGFAHENNMVGGIAGRAYVVRHQQEIAWIEERLQEQRLLQ